MSRRENLRNICGSFLRGGKFQIARCFYANFILKSIFRRSKCFSLSAFLPQCQRSRKARLRRLMCGGGYAPPAAAKLFLGAMPPGFAFGIHWPKAAPRA